MLDIALHESVQLSADLRVDEEAGIVYGVKILGNRSRNKLPPSSVPHGQQNAEMAFPLSTRARAHVLMEGAVVNWDHSSTGAKETALAARFGWLTGVREDEVGDCTRADLHYLREHVHARQFLSIVKQNPKLCGFSIFGGATRPKTKDSEGRWIVPEITSVKSFDLVADPANTMGLREAMDPATPMVDAASEMIGEEKEKAAEDNDDYTAIGCMKAIMEIANGTGSDREKLDEITKHVKQALEMDGKGDGEEMSEDDAEDEKENKDDMKESVRAVRRKHALELCESHKVEGTPERLTLLVRIPKKGREGAVKKMALVKKPRSGPPATPLRESATPAAALPVLTEEQVLAKLAQAFKG